MINCNHVGRVGEWVELAAADDVLAIMTVGGPSDIGTAPFGGAETALSTNPIAAGVPAGSRDPMILDFATSAQAVGKIRIAQARGLPVPENSILDASGNPSTDQRISLTAACCWRSAATKAPPCRFWLTRLGAG